MARLKNEVRYYQGLTAAGWALRGPVKDDHGVL